MSNPKSLINLTDFHSLVFDFDGVFTDNKVLINQNGEESVCCDRGDGLGLNLLRAFLTQRSICLDVFIVSKEKNQVAQSRAKKMNIPCYLGVDDKLVYIGDYLKNKYPLKQNLIDGVIYVGNDLNDYFMMKNAGLSFAPQDAHPRILSIASMIIPKNGGNGFVRYLIEYLIGLDDYSEESLSELICNC